MNDRSHRDYLEETLRKYIRQAEAITLTDPKLQQMVQQLRKMYSSDKESFLFAMGMAPPPPSALPLRPAPPPSRIPELLELLNSLTTGEPASLPPSVNNLPGGMPGSLTPDAVQLPDKKRPQPEKKPSPPSPARRRSQDINREKIDKIESDIENAETLLKEMKSNEPAIREKQGVYAITLERLKAERLLRELPGTIAALFKKKKKLEEDSTAPNDDSF